MERCDFLVIGAGMAGASAAWALARHGRVVVLEREPMAGAHATGRSAAMFTETYGGPLLRGLTAAGRAFFENPPPGFTETPLLRSRPVMHVGRADQVAALDRLYAESRRLVPTVARLDSAGARARAPVLREGYAAGAVLEPRADEIDVAALHQGFLRGLRARGGRLATCTEATALSRTGGVWRAETTAGACAAPVVINAAGAWCDAVAVRAGVAPIGLRPKRRTAFTFDGPAGDTGDWPMVIDVDEAFYVKPESGRILGSPADETPSEPCDAQADELDIARAADRITKATTLEIRHIRARWAGLRSFVRDGEPVAGFDTAAAGFFWLAGQGGGGIMTAPAMAAATAALATGRSLPAPLPAFRIDAARLAPARLRRA